MKSKKTIYFVLAIMAISAGAAYYFLWYRDKGLTMPGTATKPQNPNSPNINPNPGFSPLTAGTDILPLRKGSKGPRVAVLQKHLNKVMNAKLDVDGVFGDATLNALNAKYKTVSVDQWNYDNVYSKNI